ncbi:MAG: DUF1415 domain-containing protein [Betaproteobacteria bacterium]|nr:DUF1415 domain-containing protein [Betaproteobacteria bacterium]
MIDSTPHPIDDIAIEDTQKWLTKAVIDLNLCPFAKTVVVKNLIRYRVYSDNSLAELLSLLKIELMLLAHSEDSQIETTLLIAPFVLQNFIEFNDFLDEAHYLLQELVLEGVLQVADFHPQYQFAGEAMDDMSNFTNRSPYPTLHLLKESSIDRSVLAYPAAELIFEKNMTTLRQLGPQGWSHLLLKARLNSNELPHSP